MTEILEKLHTEDLLENKKEILYSLLDDEKLRFLSENMPSFFELVNN